jgi:alkylation response protein AidB-like acyl-CoA dehydrogenase
VTTPGGRAPGVEARVADPVSCVLGDGLAGLRRHVLGAVVPALDKLLADVAEEGELPPVLERLAADPVSLLDGRDAPGDLGIRHATVAVEALATGRQTYLIPVLVNALARAPIVLAGNDAQQERFLARAATRPVGTFAMTEPEAGSDVARLTTTARDDGDHVVLNGHKCWINVLDREALEWIIVWARPEGSTGHALSCFVVPADTPGVHIAQVGDMLGMRAIPLADIRLEEVRVPRTHQIGEDGRCFGLAMRCLNSVRCVVGARGLGLTARVLMDAADYVNARPSFGGTLADRQSVRATLAALAARLEAARLLTYRAAALADARDLGKEASPVHAASKWLGTELAVEAATAAMHLAGAAGYDESRTMFGRHLRDAQQLTIVEGVSEVQLELIGYGVLDGSLWWER